MRPVNLAKEKQDLSQITDIAFDEFAVGKGHEYVTLVYDLSGKRVVYIAAAKKRFPRAEVISDHFHVIKKANEMPDKAWKREAKENMDQLAKTKYVLLKNLMRSQEKRRQELLAMNEMDLDAARSYHIKLGLQRSGWCLAS